MMLCSISTVSSILPPNLTIVDHIDYIPTRQDAFGLFRPFSLLELKQLAQRAQGQSNSTAHMQAQFLASHPLLLMIFLTSSGKERIFRDQRFSYRPRDYHVRSMENPRQSGELRPYASI